ncbi:MAG: acyl-CoA thioesterase, partial [Treponema sp.]|nr:acyl-CoA thioesterase [Treponema sp.]
QVTTVAVDNLRFLAPAFLDETIRLEARVTWTGRTSLEVRVDSFAESLGGTERRINRAYLVFVALDDEGKPVRDFPPFVPATEEEKQEWKNAEKRQAQRLAARETTG